MACAYQIEEQILNAVSSGNTEVKVYNVANGQKFGVLTFTCGDVAYHVEAPVIELRRVADKDYSLGNEMPAPWPGATVFFTED